MASRHPRFSVPNQPKEWFLSEKYASQCQSAHLSQCQNRESEAVTASPLPPPDERCHRTWDIRQKGGTMPSPACVCPAEGAITLQRFTWQ